MERNATISLIVPVYNVEKYLTQCLESIVRQLVPFDEVIVVNDGSTDRSLEICKKYVSMYKYFKLISQENKGLSSARNRGICETTGEYVMFLDSDDYLRHDAVKILKEKLQKVPGDAIFFDAEISLDKNVLENKKNIYDRSLAGLDGMIMSGEEYFSRCYPKNYIVSVCMAVYRLQLIQKEKISFPEGIYYEDNYFSFVFLEHAKKVAHISEKLYYRRYRINSITTSDYSERKFSDHIQIGLLIWDEILKRSSTLTRKKEEIFLKYVSDYYCMIIERYEYCRESYIQLSENAENKLRTMAENFFMFLYVLHLEKVNENLALLNQAVKGIYCTHLYMNKNLNKEKILIQDIVKKQKRLYYVLLKKIPLNVPGAKVGIYGTGKHTEGLLMIYEKLFGKISCDLFFLDSYKDNGYIWGRKLVNYKEIGLSVDLIVLSSFIYEKEMLKNIKSIRNEVPIYRFYNDIERDIFAEYKTFSFFW